MLISSKLYAAEKMAFAVPKDRKERQKIVDQYLKIQTQFRNKICTPGTEEKFSELNQYYKNFGKFLPLNLDDKLDSKTIKAHLSLFDEKEKWISWNIDKLSLNKDFNVTYGLIKQLRKQRSDLIKLRQVHYFSKTDEDKKKVEIEAREKLMGFSREFHILIEQIPFILSFKYPIDHLELRKNYEHFKDLKTKESRAKSNSTFFYRRIVQDGMYDEEMVRNDSVLRAAIDTFMLSISNSTPRSFLTENERYDSAYLFRAIEAILDLGADKILQRLVVWRERNRQIREFYRNILENKILRDGEFLSVQKHLEEKALATFHLKDFVLKKEAEAYQYWSEQTDFFQALFAIETILYSEVGSLDGRGAEERREIALVVLNRLSADKYNHLSPDDSIYKYLDNHKDLKGKKNIEANKWLNVLFKEGEFSFTYFYIPGNLHVYCPDNTRDGQFLRRENLQIAMDTLNSGLKGYKGLRYYSRYSMQGRIEMDSVWTDYLPLPEKPGKKSAKSVALLKKYKAQKFTYLYDFQDQQKGSFLVVEIDGKSYAVKKENPKEVFNYRNQHMFKFFGPKSNEKK